MKLAFDMTLMRPACVLIAAALGANSEASSKLDAKLWLLSPTPDMKVYEITQDQLKQLAKKLEVHHG